MAKKTIEEKIAKVNADLKALHRDIEKLYRKVAKLKE